MKYRLISDTGASRLIIIFAGWGMDGNVFSGFSRTGYDILVLWDYRSFFIDWSITEKYEEICILAWSMGVFAASQTTQSIEHKITRRVAVAGTPEPISKSYGIPEDIYEATLKNLAPATLRKFYRRMCSDKATFDLFAANAPQRDVEELKEELTAIADRLILHTPSTAAWDIAYVTKDDRIFPFINQMAAWQKSSTCTRILDGCGHFFDFRKIIEREFIDKSTVKQRFEAGTPSYDDHAAVQNEVIEHIEQHINELNIGAAMMHAQNAVLEIGSGSGMLSRRIARLIDHAQYIMWDLSSPCPEALPIGRSYHFKNCDAEMEIGRLAPESIDHIVTASTVQWFNSPRRFFEACHRALRPDGYLIMSTYREGNLHQISDITGRSLPLLSGLQWLYIAKPWFKFLKVEWFDRDLDFASPHDALRHLKLTGVNGMNGSAADARKVMRSLPMMLDARYHLTYKPLILILQKK